MLFERAKQYADDVISGKEITTPEVKKQCEWFYRDLQREKNDEYPYFFDLEFAKKLEGLLQLMNFATGIGVVGKSVYDGLENFQAFFLVNVFCWRYKSDKREYRYREVVLFIPRKNAKTFICAVIFIILMLTEDEYS